MAVILPAELPQVPTDQIGQWMLCLILFAYLANQIKKLMGWDGPTREEREEKEEKLEKLTSKVELCATKEELTDLKKEVIQKYDKIEQYARDRAHDTINAVNNLGLTLEKMKVEIIKEMASQSQRNEDRWNEFLLGKLDSQTRGAKRGG